MFSSPAIRVYNHQSQENNIARKPGINNSARKPLGDRAVNLKATPNQFKSLKPDVIPPAKKTASPKTDYPDWLMDTCSFKDVKDTYEDIWPKSERLNKIDIMKFIEPKTPPFKGSFELDPMVFELPQEKRFIIRDENLFEEKPIDDVEFPDFVF